MAQNRSAALPVERVFDAPGRTRIAVSGLKGRSDTARRLEELLRSNPGFHEVKASPVTGRVLILYSEELVSDAVHGTVLRLHAELFAEIPVDAVVRRPPMQIPGTSPAGIALGAAASFAAVSILSGSIAGALVAGAVAGLTGLLFAAWNRFAARNPGVVRSLTARLLPQVAGDPHFAELVRPHAPQFARAVLASAGAALSGIVRIAAMGFSIDLLLGGTVTLPFGLVLATPGTAFVLMGVAVAITGVQMWIRHRSHVLWSNAGREIQHALRVRAYDRVQRFEMRLVQERTRGELLSVLVTDIDNLEKAADASWSLMDLTVSSAALVTSIAYIAAHAALWVMVPIPVLVGLSVYLYPKLREGFGRVRRHSAQLSARLSNQLEGLEIVKSFNAEERELERLREASAAYLAEGRKAIEIQSGVPLLLEGTILTGIVLTYRMNAVLTLARGLSLGHFQTLNMFTGHLVFPMLSMGMHIDNLGEGMASLRRALELLSNEEESDADSGLRPIPAEAVRGDVTYRGVDFSYGAGRPVLQGVSLTFPAGSTTAVVGLSGSGKTTLIKLLLRLYGAHSGSIEVGGYDIATVERRSLREAISVVSQDVYLFDRSVMENIRISRPDATEEEVIEAAKIGQAHDFIMRLPDGYQTRLGERGSLLSGGQRQCLSIARAVLKDSPIMIFDEATSSLDSNTEASIARALRRAEAGRTVIMIAHRLATVRNADWIYALEDGEIIAEGRHEDLIRQPGRYRSLWRDQIGASAAD